MDPVGNILFAAGLSSSLLGLTLGALLGWSTVLLGAIAGGVACIAAFAFAETKVKFPMMDLSLFKIRAFSAGMASNLMASLSRGGALPRTRILLPRGAAAGCFLSRPDANPVLGRLRHVRTPQRLSV